MLDTARTLAVLLSALISAVLFLSLWSSTNGQPPYGQIIDQLENVVTPVETKHSDFIVPAIVIVIIFGLFLKYVVPLINVVT